MLGFLRFQNCLIFAAKPQFANLLRPDSSTTAFNAAFVCSLLR